MLRFRPKLIEISASKGATHWVSLSPQIKTTEPDVSVSPTGETHQLSPTDITRRSPSLARSQSVANKHSAGEDMHVANMFLSSDNAESTFSFFKKGISVSTVQIHST